ncbi:HNH endonuclease [Actinophytocola sediminis]
MKRSPMSHRRTVLRSGDPLKRRKNLARRSAGLRARATKPGLRAVERAARQAVYARSGRLCEGPCGARRALDWHHRQRDGQGGAWSPQNGMHLCRPCHRWITEHPAEARARGWHVWSHENPADVPVWRRQDAWVRLTPAGGLAEVEDYPGSTDRQCFALISCLDDILRCERGELHDGDHINGLVRRPVTDEERMAWRITA